MPTPGHEYVFLYEGVVSRGGHCFDPNIDYSLIGHRLQGMYSGISGLRSVFNGCCPPLTSVRAAHHVNGLRSYIGFHLGLKLSPLWVYEYNQ